MIPPELVSPYLHSIFMYIDPVAIISGLGLDKSYSGRGAIYLEGHIQSVFHDSRVHVPDLRCKILLSKHLCDLLKNLTVK